MVGRPKRTTPNICKIAIAERKAYRESRKSEKKSSMRKQSKKDIAFFNARFNVALSIMKKIPRNLIIAMDEELKLKRLIKELKNENT